MGASAAYLKLLHTVILLCSLVIIGYSAYLLSQFGDLKEGITTAPILVPLVFGVFLFLVSVLGLVGAVKRNKCLIFLHIIVSTAITIVVLGCGIALLVYSGELDKVKNFDADQKIEAKIQDFELAIFVKCCAEPFQLAEPQNCADTTDPVCVDDDALFQEFKDQIGSKVCDALSNVELDGHPLVGTPAPGTCGAGSADVFVIDISTALKDNLKPLGITNLVLGVIMLLDLIASCVLLWTKKTEYYDGVPAKKIPEAQVVGDEKAAPELATGGINYTSGRF